MFQIGKFYKTKNGSKVVCHGGPDKDGDFIMLVVSGGHDVSDRAGKSIGGYYWVTSEGKYPDSGAHRSDISHKLHGMDVTGPWEEG